MSVWANAKADTTGILAVDALTPLNWTDATTMSRTQSIKITIIDAVRNNKNSWSEQSGKVAGVHGTKQNGYRKFHLWLTTFSKREDIIIHSWLKVYSRINKKGASMSLDSTNDDDDLFECRKQKHQWHGQICSYQAEQGSFSCKSNALLSFLKIELISNT